MRKRVPEKKGEILREMQEKKGTRIKKTILAQAEV
jgi:hypothetical protein